LEGSTTLQGLTEVEQSVIKLAGQVARDFAEAASTAPG
jgi:hypothetical protein